jgi:hypothetical protein
VTVAAAAAAAATAAAGKRPALRQAAVCRCKEVERVHPRRRRQLGVWFQRRPDRYSIYLLY